jgi:hypothetical protein
VIFVEIHLKTVVKPPSGAFLGNFQKIRVIERFNLKAIYAMSSGHKAGMADARFDAKTSRSFFTRYSAFYGF